MNMNNVPQDSQAPQAPQANNRREDYAHRAQEGSLREWNLSALKIRKAKLKRDIDELKLMISEKQLWIIRIDEAMEEVSEMQVQAKRAARIKRK